MAAETRYSRDHEWVRIEGDVATIGITGYAADQLGDVVFVELPEVGRSVTKGEAAAVVESVKAASDVYSPLSGEVVETNAGLEASPGSVNEAPEADGWFMKLKLSDAGQTRDLLDAAAYKAFTDSL